MLVTIFLLFSSQPQDAVLKNILVKSGFGLQVDVRWNKWSECDTCNKVQTGYSRCQLIPYIRTQGLCGDIRKQCEMFNKSLRMDCSMFWTVKEISPTLADRVRSIPDFNISVPCTGPCSTDAKRTVTKKMRKIHVGDSLIFNCLAYGARNACYWRWDGIKLTPDEYDWRKRVS